MKNGNIYTNHDFTIRLVVRSSPWFPHKTQDNFGVLDYRMTPRDEYRTGRLVIIDCYLKKKKIMIVTTELAMKRIDRGARLMDFDIKIRSACVRLFCEFYDIHIYITLLLRRYYDDVMMRFSPLYYTRKCREVFRIYSYILASVSTRNALSNFSTKEENRRV